MSRAVFTAVVLLAAGLTSACDSPRREARVTPCESSGDETDGSDVLGMWRYPLMGPRGETVEDSLYIDGDHVVAHFAGSSVVIGEGCIASLGDDDAIAMPMVREGSTVVFGACTQAAARLTIRDGALAFDDGTRLRRVPEAEWTAWERDLLSTDRVGQVTGQPAWMLELGATRLAAVREICGTTIPAAPEPEVTRFWRYLAAVAAPVCACDESSALADALRRARARGSWDVAFDDALCGSDPLWVRACRARRDASELAEAFPAAAFPERTSP